MYFNVLTMNLEALKIPTLYSASYSHRHFLLYSGSLKECE